MVNGYIALGCNVAKQDIVMTVKFNRIQNVLGLPKW